jgi:hypothetical protein
MTYGDLIFFIGVLVYLLSVSFIWWLDERLTDLEIYEDVKYFIRYLWHEYVINGLSKSRLSFRITKLFDGKYRKYQWHIYTVRQIKNMEVKYK